MSTESWELQVRPCRPDTARSASQRSAPSASACGTLRSRAEFRRRRSASLCVALLQTAGPSVWRLFWRSCPKYPKAAVNRKVAGDPKPFASYPATDGTVVVETFPALRGMRTSKRAPTAAHFRCRSASYHQRRSSSWFRRITSKEPNRPPYKRVRPSGDTAGSHSSPRVAVSRAISPVEMSIMNRSQFPSALAA